MAVLHHIAEGQELKRVGKNYIIGKVDEALGEFIIAVIRYLNVY